MNYNQIWYYAGGLAWEASSGCQGQGQGQGHQQVSPGPLGAAEKELKRGRFHLQPLFCGVVSAQDEVDGAEWV